VRLGVRAAETFEVKSFTTVKLVMGGLALAAILAAAPVWAGTRRPVDDAAYGPKTVRKDAAAVARQRAEVLRLQHDVAAQESSSRTAAQRLKQQDAQIAELQRQLQTAQQAGAGAGKGR